MRSAVALLSLSLVAAACFLAPHAHACGDKFLVPGREAGFDETYAAIHPASILIYRNESSEYAEAVFGNYIKDALENAGHMVSIVGTSGLSRALLSGDHDIVLAELPDAITVDQGLRAAPYQPLIVPLAIKPSKEELARAAEQYHHVFEVVERGLPNLLLLLDEAMMMAEQQPPLAPAHP